MKVKINTRLVGRDDVFKLLVVSQLTKYPVLLIGERGTGKTQIFLDYVGSVMRDGEKYFVKQLNYDTRIEDLIGYVSIPALREGKIERINGIQDSKYILLDEIDKANSAVRNLFLSFLRERAIFDGEKFVKCVWELVVGTTNRDVNQFDEDDIPFLDRFLYKYKVERIPINAVEKLFRSGKNSRVIAIEIKNVGKDEIERAMRIVEKILPDIYEFASDRTIARLPEALEGFLKIEKSLNDAVVKTITYTLGPEVAMKVLEKLDVSKHVLKARELIDAYNNASDEESKSVAVANMIKYVKSLKTDPNTDRKVVQEVENLLKPYITV